MRGGTFAVFVDSREQHHDLSPMPGVPYIQPFPPRVRQTRAAGVTAVAAGRLLALERQGAVRACALDRGLDRAAEDAAARGRAPLRGRGGDRSRQLESIETWYAAGLRSLGPVWSRPNAFAHGVPFAFPSSPDTGPGPRPAGARLVRRCAELGIAVDLSHMNEAGFWDVARLDRGAAHRQPCRRARAVRLLAQPHRRSDRRGGEVRRPGRDRVRLLLPARRTSPTSPTPRRSS